MMEEPDEQHTRGPSSPWAYPVGEDEGQNDPDTMLPYMLFEQESHDLICPVCEHPVTGEVILQKRKRELEAGLTGGRPHEIQAHLHKGAKPREGLSKRAIEDSSEDSAEEGELDVDSALKEQTNYDLLCPDCESCITHDLILQKRKRAVSASDTSPQRKSWTERRGARPNREHSHPRRSGGEIEELYDLDDNDPPSKRHRRSERSANLDPERSTVPRVLQNQRLYDLSCPDCASDITYQVILKQKQSASGHPLGLLEKRGRHRRKSSGFIDDNPWKTRYKLLHGHSKPQSSAQKAMHERQQGRGRRHGTSAADRAPAQAKEPEDPRLRGIREAEAVAEGSPTKPGRYKDSQLQGEKQGRTTAKRADGSLSTQSDESGGRQPGPAKYASATTERSLTEPLLQGKQDGTEDEVGPRSTTASGYVDMSQLQTVGPFALMYFVVFVFLYCVWWFLSVV